jgi:cysteine synthase B
MLAFPQGEESRDPGDRRAAGAGAQVPGIRKWPEAIPAAIFERARVDRVIEVTQEESEEMTRRLAREEGIFAGISSGGGLAAAMRVAPRCATR